ncbi:threonine/serine dehydratase [Phenylobacterium sp.]|uniref:threonine ammonia-lyase n=1 Tax=Phenylobacterium sp. TaxID=1871053 RepID=UPI002ED89B9C
MSDTTVADGPGPTLEALREAHRRLRNHVVRTPLLRMTPSGLWLKPENLQPTGAFKLRGAFNAILSLSSEARARGVVAHSSGNHAMAVAYAAARLGVRAVIVMPSDAPATKRAGVQQAGGEIVTVGPASAERAERASALAAAHGYALIEPYDAPEIVAATGGLALEILEDLPNATTVYAPVSGGGLIGGLAAGLKRLKPEIRVVGVEPEVAADAAASLAAGRRIALSAEEMSRTLADGLRVQQLGRLTWPLVQAYVDEVVTVSEAAIRFAMRRIAREARQVAEPSGAVACAGALAHASDPTFAVAVLSGGNVDTSLLAAVFAEGDEEGPACV